MTSRQAVDTGIRFDQFGKMKTSTPYILFDGRTLFDKQEHIFDEKIDVGTTSVFLENQAMVEMKVTDNISGSVIRQSYQRSYYQPGKSQEILISHILGEGGSGITKRIGYFDEKNGIFLEQLNTIVNVVIRSNTSGVVTERRVSQSDWNLDTLDELDVSKSNIFFIEFEWLGVGDVIVGFAIGNVFRQVHQFRNSNIIDNVYMSIPNLPIRYEITNDGTGLENSLKPICSSVITDGGIEPTYSLRSYDIEKTAISVNGNLTKLIAIRPKIDKKGAIIYPYAFTFSTSANNIYLRYVLLKNPIVDTNSYVFSNVNNNSHVEVDINTTNPPTLSGGEVILSGYAVSQSILQYDITKLATKVSLGWSIDGTRDIIVLAIQRVDSTQSVNVYCSLTVQEI